MSFPFLFLTVNSTKVGKYGFFYKDQSLWHNGTVLYWVQQKISTLVTVCIFGTFLGDCFPHIDTTVSHSLLNVVI